MIIIYDHYILRWTFTRSKDQNKRIFYTWNVVCCPSCSWKRWILAIWRALRWTFTWAYSRETRKESWILDRYSAHPIFTMKISSHSFQTAHQASWKTEISSRAITFEVSPKLEVLDPKDYRGNPALEASSSRSWSLACRPSAVTPFADDALL